MRKRNILILVFLLMLVSTSVWVLSSQSTGTPASFETPLEKKSYLLKSFDQLPDIEITLLDAYQLGLKQAQAYDINAGLLFLNSVDDGKVSGSNGKKANWQGVFVLPVKQRNMLIVIENGKLKGYRIYDRSDELVIKKEEMQTDSTQIVNSAIKQFRLQPSPIDDPFFHGFHFKVLRDENRAFIAVDGQINGSHVEIYFNPENGNYLGRTEGSKK